MLRHWFTITGVWIVLVITIWCLGLFSVHYTAAKEDINLTAWNRIQQILNPPPARQPSMKLINPKLPRNLPYVLEEEREL